MHRSMLDRGLGRVLCVTLVVACSEPLAPAFPERGPRPLRPTLELVEDNTLPVGALIHEVTIGMPEEGAVSGSAVLLNLGDVTGPVVVELAGEITAPPQSVPVTELLAPGAVMWFHVNGDFYIRFASIAVVQVNPGGGRELQSLQPSAPRNQIRFRDQGAGLHGLEVVWDFGEPVWTGRNLNDPHWGNLCPGLDDDVVCWVAPADRISDAAPQGTITVRVYQAVETRRVRVRAVSGPLEVAPQGTGSNVLPLYVEVLDAEDMPIPNRTVVLSLTPKEGTAGHLHIGGKPRSTLSLFTVATGSGTAEVTYTAPEFSGPVAIHGTSDSALDALDTIRVRVSGLMPLGPGAAYALISDPGEHEGPYHGTPAFLGALKTLADSLAAFANQIPSLPPSKRPTGMFPSKLGVNDLSLVEGGRYDLNGNWTGEHSDHRVGTNADIDVRGGSEWDGYAKYVQFIWETRLHHKVGDERTTKHHFHLVF
ncbi:MAG TPA: hypothetical protein VLV16_12880 [Gemmatimonadales bacterium]|nr:hypothetical protein [Gemmatimonadales bacterium]